MFKLARDGVSPVSQEDRTFLPLFPLTQIKDHKKTTKWHPCQCVCGPAAPRIIGGSGSLEVQGPVLCGGRTVLTSKLVVRNEETCRVLSFWVGALTSMDCTPWGPDTVGYRLCKNCNLQKHTHTHTGIHIYTQTQQWVWGETSSASHTRHTCKQRHTDKTVFVLRS